MPIGLIRVITTQKVHKTYINKGVKWHYLGSNNTPNRHIISPLAMKEDESNQKQDELYTSVNKKFSKSKKGIKFNLQKESSKSYPMTVLRRVCVMKIHVSK